MIKIIVDCFGGDHSPEANVDGAIASLGKFEDLHLILSGDEAIIRRCLEGKQWDASRVEILHAPQVIGCDEKPTDVIRLKRDSSMIKAIRLLRDDDSVAAMVSTGSTGALVAGALTRIGRLQGVIRPAFGIIFCGAREPDAESGGGERFGAQSLRIAEAASIFGICGPAQRGQQYPGVRESSGDAR